MKILIYGLGSCIALILYDGIAKLSAMTHIYLPKSSIGYFEENFPQKHADTAVMDLLNQMIKSGAKKENIKACIFGGATIFKESYSDMGERNSESVKNELKSLNIKIEREFIGGRKGSTIIFDVKNKIVLLPNLNKKIKIWNIFVLELIINSSINKAQINIKITISKTKVTYFADSSLTLWIL